MGEWKQIPGYKLYKINQNGIVLYRGKPVAWTYCTNGYPQVTVCDLVRRISVNVHKLVAITFLRPLLPGEEINHIDKKRNNPRLSNLEILTSKEHGRKHRKREYRLCPTCLMNEVVSPRQYCSAECRHEALWEKRTCKVCQTEFKMRKSYIKARLNDPKYKNIGVYCSNSCRFSDAKYLERDQDYLNKVRKLSPEQVAEIRELFCVLNNTEIARIYGVSRGLIRSLRNGITYKSFIHPQDPPALNQEPSRHDLYVGQTGSRNEVSLGVGI